VSAGVPDVIVVGLGGMGSSAAHALAARGARVLGLERFGPAHAFGASHGGSRIIRMAYFEDPSYVPLLRTAYDLWRRLEQDSGRALLATCGGLFLGPAGSQVFDGTLLAAREHVLEQADVRRRYPVLTPDARTLAVYEAVAGIVPPEAAVEVQLELARRAGAELHFETPVLSWSTDGSGVVVYTADRTHRADRLVLAPGAWAPALLDLPGLPLRVERRVQMWFAPTGQHEAFAALPVWVWERADGLEFYGFPLRDGAVKVALHNRGAGCDPDTVDRAVSDSEVEQMREVLRGALPALAAGPLVRAAACTYTLTPDGHFVLALHPRYPQVSVACGFSGHGFKFTPVVGEVLADLALNGVTSLPIALFDPARLS